MKISPGIIIVIWKTTIFYSTQDIPANYILRQLKISQGKYDNNFTN